MGDPFLCASAWRGGVSVPVGVETDERERARTIESVLGELDVEDGGRGELQVHERLAAVLWIALDELAAWWCLICSVMCERQRGTKKASKENRSDAHRRKGFARCSSAKASLTNS